VCRTPGFWGTHAEANPKKPNSQDITGFFLAQPPQPFVVCGVTLTNTDVGVPGSAQEALCVAVQGDLQLQLARQLTAAQLNCRVESCPQDVLTLLDNCEATCVAHNSQDDIGSCVEQLDLFNNGNFNDATGCHDRTIPGFEPPGPAGSSSDCNAAIQNSCTIFSCP